MLLERNSGWGKGIKAKCLKVLLQLPDFDPLNSMRYLLKAYIGTRYKKEIGEKKEWT